MLPPKPLPAEKAAFMCRLAIMASEKRPGNQHGAYMYVNTAFELQCVRLLFIFMLEKAAPGIRSKKQQRFTELFYHFTLRKWITAPEARYHCSEMSTFLANKHAETNIFDMKCNLQQYLFHKGTSTL